MGWELGVQRCIERYWGGEGIGFFVYLAVGLHREGCSFTSRLA